MRAVRRLCLGQLLQGEHGPVQAVRGVLPAAVRVPALLLAPLEGVEGGAGGLVTAGAGGGAVHVEVADQLLGDAGPVTTLELQVELGKRQTTHTAVAAGG